MKGVAIGGTFFYYIEKNMYLCNIYFAEYVYIDS